VPSLSVVETFGTKSTLGTFSLGRLFEKLLASIYFQFSAVLDIAMQCRSLVT